MFARMRSNRRLRTALLILIVLGAWWIQQRRGGGQTDQAPPLPERGGIEAAYEAGLSGDWFEAEGSVDRTLADDNEGSRHQRFILELPSGHTVLVAHNIDLAERVPLERGDRVSLRGEYEWTERGGVLHWTHHDPRGRKAGGWIEIEGRRYE